MSITDTDLVHIKLSKALIKEIDRYALENNIKFRYEAVSILLCHALECSEKPRSNGK